MSKPVLILSAHPDDETLGAGGTVLRHSKQGDKIIWLIVTNIFEHQGFSKQRVSKRQKEIEQVAECYNVQETVKLDYPTMSLSSDDLGSLISDISEVVSSHTPEVIYTMNRSDAHSDHRVVFDAVMACTKSFRYPFIREVLMYECISETEFAPALPEKQFQPNCYVDISDELEEKIKIMNIFKSELGTHPFPRSERNIKAVATHRGATAGVEYAEAFQIIKSYRFETL
ncbi:PIG-L deacetylase family protein [Halalkalibaculum sp. DA384]|uniref:PIG-L deacetylase family protein n=1 Tax=Halalkalibaculum sp. DA384 TaxID=3373606 RepID=UPI0037542847